MYVILVCRVSDMIFIYYLICHALLSTYSELCRLVMISVFNEFRYSGWLEFISCGVAAKILGKEGGDDLPIVK